MSLFSELKRRNVFRVGIAYMVGAWLLLQITDVVLNNIDAPGWVFKATMLMVSIGLPVALFFAWAFELTPDGVKRESEVDRSQSIRSETGQKMNRGIILVLVLAVVYFVWESRFSENGSGSGHSGLGSEPFSLESTAPLTKTGEEKRGATPVGASPAGATPVGATPVGASAGEAQSVAVLPFVNMSSDPEQEYFSDGITEEIINALVKIPGLSVPARTSVFGFKGHQGDVRKIGMELGVAHVLEGSIRSQGKQVRITAQLIKVDDGFHLWSETYDRQLDNIFAVQEEIAASIAEILTGELGLEVTTVPNQTLNMEAYDTYLQGRALLRNRDKKAIEVLESATLADPDFAPAWAALSIAYQSSGNTAFDSKVQSTAKKALQLDPDNVDALDAIASYFRSSMQWQEAEGYFDRALAIDPHSAELLEDYAEFLAKVGRTAEALRITTRGYAIEPNLGPLTLAHMEALLSSNKLDEALDLARRTIAAHPEPSRLWRETLPVFLARSGSIPAAELVDKLDLPTDMRPAVSAILTDRNDNLAIEQLKEWYPEDHLQQPELWAQVRMARVLLVYAGASDYVLDIDQATMDRNSGGIEEWGWTPIFQSLRQNPRYEQYLQKAGLIEYWDATAWPDWCQRKNDGKVVCK